LPRYHFRSPPRGGLEALSRSLAVADYRTPARREGSPAPLRDVFRPIRAPSRTGRGLSEA